LRKRYFFVSGGFGLLGVLLFAGSFGVVLNSFNNVKEESFRKLYAVQLSNEQDPIGEYLFEEIAQKIQTDTVFLQGLYVSSEPSVFAEQYLKKKYLGGYFSKYHLQVTTCIPEQVLLIMPANIQAQCNVFFQSLKTDFGSPTMVPNYWLIDDETGRPNYLFETGFLKKNKNQTDTMLMFVEMITIPKISGLGYPELLVEERVLRKTGRFDYAYAKYFKNELITQYGDYYYPLIADSSQQVNEIIFIEKNGYSHLLYPVNKKTTIHVSLPLKKPFEKAATFSYLLIVFVIFHYLLLALISVTIRESFFQMFSFKTRLQSASVFLVILCFIVAGVITVNFFIRYHNNKNKEIIREKSYSLLVELEHKLRNYEALGQGDKELLSELMVKFSNVFFTDINLFSTSGNLLATSRPQVYQQGLISSYMNPDALSKLQETHTPYLLQSEAIGSLSFTSTYLPFKNYRNEVIAYLNLPYFARENELRKEISTFLIAFMNFYVMLIALAIILALVVSNYITLPLRTIGEKLRALKPGQPNEKIPWNKHDDIGVLVGEYNRMVDELADSTRLLMKTERETAWREMAKQIAHEIKNPLTPMKLSLQNLQRAWNDKAPDYEERLKRTSQILIEQIDALSQIATEFSNFARMQEAKLYPVDVVPLINDALHLYQSDLASIEFSYQDSTSYMILADDTQIIQILNNILKNAVQSLSPKEKGNVFIQAEKSAGKVVVSIRDNGCGIPDDIRHKIFSPNFTSKSGGTGLGLAITKKITDNLGGSISFESEINKGSTFYISFPEYVAQPNE
jgi:two-component system, NtrC family, nitrogen regulation sensor histidine kinase NtrY